MNKIDATSRANELLKVILENQPGLLDKSTVNVNGAGGTQAGAFITALRASLIAMYEAD